eukprot:COSAG04_NODE_5325_length_1655_cov_105.250000_1_plen_78_part_00
MSDKPMTDYLNHKYPVDEAAERSLQAILSQINRLLKRTHQLEVDASKMKTELDSMGEYLCDTSMCKKRYKGCEGVGR